MESYISTQKCTSGQLPLVCLVLGVFAEPLVVFDTGLTKKPSCHHITLDISNSFDC